MPDIQAPAYTLPAGPIGVLLVHGFTASPTELRTLGDYLHQAGFSIQGVRTAGHGTNADDLGKYTRRDWYASVEASTGFGPPWDDVVEVAPEHRDVVEALWPAWELLSSKKLGGPVCGDD